MPRPGKPYPPKVTARDAWTNDFIVAVQAESDLRDGKFLRAVAAMQFEAPGRPESAREAAKAWLAKRAD